MDKQVSGTLELFFTTSDIKMLKTPRIMKLEIAHIACLAIENYLASMGVVENECHVITIDDLYIGYVED